MVPKMCQIKCKRIIEKLFMILFKKLQAKKEWKQVDISCDCVEGIASKIETKIEINCLWLSWR